LNHTLIFNVSENRTGRARQLGAYRMAHWLRVHDWDAEVIEWASLWSYEELTQLATTRITSDTKFIGFSFLFDQWTPTLEKFAFWIKATYPHVAIISGSSTYPLENSPVDYHISGFGEKALQVLLKYLFSNGEAPKYKKFGDISVIDGKNYPAYPMTEYSVHYEDRDFLNPWEIICIETGRGCIFKCLFCAHPVLGVKTDHSASAESFERQLKDNYYRWGIKNYVLSEETFNDRQDKIKKFAGVVNSLDFDPWFTGFVRLDLVISRPDDKKLLEDMHVFGQFYGIESFNPQTAKAFKKGMPPEKIKDGLLEVKDYYSKSGKYRGTSSFILGGPHEPVQSMYDTLNWLTDNWSDQAVSFYPLGIPIGKNNRPSELSDNYEKYGYKELDLTRYHNHPKINDMKDKGSGWLLWENEYLDIVEAQNIYQDYANVVEQYEFKMDNFMLSRYTGENSTVEDKLTYTINDSLGTKGHEWIGDVIKIQADYIRKKINWGLL